MNYIQEAEKVIEKTLRTGCLVICPWSMGKDSSTVLNLIVTQAARLIANEPTALCSPILVVNADTKLENPAVTQLLNGYIEQLRSYCDQHNVSLNYQQSTPALNSEWVVKILSGRDLPVFANRKFRSCSIDLKIKPMERLKKQLLGNTSKSFKPVTMLGTRYAEGSGREERMLARGEDASSVWVNEAGDNMLSPIAGWSDQEVWHYIKSVSLGQRDGFSNFESLIQLYQDGSSLEANSSISPSIPSCRFGCSLCCCGRDKSMENLLQNNPERYGYMAGIHKLQKFLLATQYDFDRRQWLSRTITDGYLGIFPDTYSPQMLEDLFLMILTLDIREAEAADKLGIEPRFQLLHPRAIIAVDALWSLQGLTRPHHGLFLFKKVYRDGFRMDIPEVVTKKKTTIPEKRYFYVGDDWQQESSKWNYCGLQDVNLEIATDASNSSGCGQREVLGNGRTVIEPEYSISGLFDVDEESAMMVLGFELDYLLAKHSDPHAVSTSAYRNYTTMGVLNLSNKRQAASSDFILRRTSFREAAGLTGANFDKEKIIAQSISRAEMCQKSDRRGNPVHQVKSGMTQLPLFAECA